MICRSGLGIAFDSARKSPAIDADGIREQLEILGPSKPRREYRVFTLPDVAKLSAFKPAEIGEVIHDMAPLTKYGPVQVKELESNRMSLRKRLRISTCVPDAAER